mmetsp:Transcript_12623/g.50468  ORF Transcript_12623/g.50468 Transcript_12623/m.50468 type:complete len:233 (+) Transcript_12623:3094-3792(+)
MRSGADGLAAPVDVEVLDGGPLGKHVVVVGRRRVTALAEGENELRGPRVAHVCDEAHRGARRDGAGHLRGGVGGVGRVLRAAHLCEAVVAHWQRHQVVEERLVHAAVLRHLAAVSSVEVDDVLEARGGVLLAGDAPVCAGGVVALAAGGGVVEDAGHEVGVAVGAAHLVGGHVVETVHPPLEHRRLCGVHALLGVPAQQLLVHLLRLGVREHEVVQRRVEVREEERRHVALD